MCSQQQCSPVRVPKTRHPRRYFLVKHRMNPPPLHSWPSHQLWLFWTLCHQLNKADRTGSVCSSLWLTALWQMASTGDPQNAGHPTCSPGACIPPSRAGVNSFLLHLGRLGTCSPAKARRTVSHLLLKLGHGRPHSVPLWL